MDCDHRTDDATSRARAQRPDGRRGSCDGDGAHSTLLHYPLNCLEVSLTCVRFAPDFNKPVRRSFASRTLQEALQVSDVKTGSSMCGGIQFSYRGELSDFSLCHCIMCQKFSGTLVPNLTSLVSTPAGAMWVVVLIGVTEISQ